MKILVEITERMAGIGNGGESLGSSYQLRKSARAILLNNKGEMATQYVANYTFHKLPGGGVDECESVEEALMREVKEEVGCACEIVRPVGMTIEYRNKYQLLHISYCFVAKVAGDILTPTLEAGEIEEGQETHWLPPKVVLEKMKHDAPQKYEGYFILVREQAFLEEFLKFGDYKMV
jgi:8-oxo-dGTP diphosphatase